MEWLLISKSQMVELFWSPEFITCMQTFQSDNVSLNDPEENFCKGLQGKRDYFYPHMAWYHWKYGLLAGRFCNQTWKISSTSQK